MPQQQWSASADGGYLSINTLSGKLRKASQPIIKLRNFVKPIEAYGLHKGNIKYFDRVGNVATAGSTINESATIPKTKLTISQGSVTVNEYGNSVDYTGKVEALAEMSVSDMVIAGLRDDMMKAINTAVASAFTGCKIKFAPTGDSTTPGGTFDTDGTQSTAATRNIQCYDIKEIVDYMTDTLFVPYYDGENYICVGQKSAFRQIYDDAEFEKVQHYAEPQARLRGEVGRYYGVRFVLDTHAISSTLGSYKGRCVIFGREPVVEAIAIREEIRYKIPGDFGRDKGIAWYGMFGFAEVWPTATAGEAKIIEIRSA